MPQGTTPIALPPPKGGVRADVQPYEIPEGFLWRSNNVVDLYGQITTRPGLSLAGVTQPGGSRISGLFHFLTPAGVDVAVAANLTKWWHLVGSTWTDISGAVTFTNSADQPTMFTMMPSAGVNYLIGTNDKDALYKWDPAAGAIVALGGAPPSSARDITQSSGYLMAVNTVEGGIRFGCRVRLSDFNDPDTWPGQFTFDLTDTEDNLVACRHIGRLNVVIYKEQSVWLAQAQAAIFPFTFDLLDQVPGPCSPACVVDVDQEQYYFGRDGRIYRVTLLGAQPVSEPVDGFIQRPNQLTSFRSVNRKRVFGYLNPFDRRVFFHYPGPTQTDPYLAVSYKLDTQAFHLHSYPITLTAGAPGDELAALSWNDLGAFTWLTIAGTYPSWNAFGGTQIATAFVGDVLGNVYRARYDTGDNGVAISASFELPLKPWVGLQNLQHLDGIESFFDALPPGGPFVTVQVGQSEAMADVNTLTYSTLGTHNTSLTTRQKLTLPNLNARFLSIKYSYLASQAVPFNGGAMYEWGEEMAQ